MLSSLSITCAPELACRIAVTSFSSPAKPMFPTTSKASEGAVIFIPTLLFVESTFNTFVSTAKSPVKDRGLASIAAVIVPFAGVPTLTWWTASFVALSGASAIVSVVPLTL